jgi:hypothetical protein
LADPAKKMFRFHGFFDPFFPQIPMVLDVPRTWINQLLNSGGGVEVQVYDGRALHIFLNMDRACLAA